MFTFSILLFWVTQTNTNTFTETNTGHFSGERQIGVMTCRKVLLGIKHGDYAITVYIYGIHLNH